MGDTNCPEGADCGIHNRRDVEVYYDPETRGALLYCSSYVGNHVVFTAESAPAHFGATHFLTWMLAGPVYETHVLRVGNLCLNDMVNDSLLEVRRQSKWREEYFDSDNIVERHHMVVDMLRSDILELK